MALADFTALIADLVRDPDVRISDDQRDRALALAVIRYSQDRPLNMLVNIDAPGGSFLQLPAPWVEGLSALDGCWTDYETDHRRPLSATVELTLQGYQIRVVPAPVADQTVTVAWTTAHVIDGEADIDTVPAVHREPVASWAAALLFDQLAAEYAGHKDSSFQADAVDWQTKSNDYARRANALRKRYHQMVGVDPGRARPASAIVDLDLTDSRNRDRFNHSGRNR